MSDEGAFLIVFFCFPLCLSERSVSKAFHSLAAIIFVVVSSLGMSQALLFLGQARGQIDQENLP